MHNIKYITHVYAFLLTVFKGWVVVRESEGGRAGAEYAEDSEG